MDSQRNQVPFQLVAAIVLLLIPIGLFGWLFIKQSNKDIAFAKKEIAGVQYLEALMPVYHAIAENRRPTRQQVDVFIMASSRFDRVMNTQSQSARLLFDLNKSSLGPTKSAARALITRIGDQSNLILDPDLDSYYMMDAVLLKIPEIFELVSALAYDTKGEAEMLSRIQLGSARTGLASAITAAYEANSGSLNASTKERARAFDAALSAKLNIHPFDSESLSQEALMLWKASAEDLKKLLVIRIENLIGRMLTALTIGIAVALVALFFSARIMRYVLSRLDDRIVYLAHRDLLTGLLNRSSITDEVKRAIAAAEKSGKQMALHLIDLDRFKWINDSFGHHSGDKVINEMGARLSAIADTTCVVGRLGGDEFVVVQRGVSDENEALSLGNRICAAMQQPFHVEGQQVRTSSSVGIAMSPSQTNDPSKLMKYADMALYKAKAFGKNRSVLYCTDFADELHAKMLIEGAVRKAADEDGFSLAFQPQFDASGKVLKGFEALLRLDGFDGKPISPAVFVPIAEQLSLISKIGAWVLMRACTVAKLWPESLTVAVNLSPEQFREPGISKVVSDVLTKTGLAPHRLEVEITEGMILDNSEAVMAELTALKEIGVSIAMDDFGTGYSSLSYLLRFPFNKLKIDRSILNEAVAGENRNLREVLETIVALGHRLRMRVVAEGVETVDQAELLKAMACDEIQGFLYGRPIPETDVAALILSRFRDQRAVDIAPAVAQKTSA
jgi:diguanylate cyclase (GGDEF)-like protein